MADCLASFEEQVNVLLINGWFVTPFTYKLQIFNNLRS